MLGILVAILAIFAYGWSYARSRDKIRSLLIATLFLGGGFAIGRPLLAYIGNTPERVAEQKRQMVAKALKDHAVFQALQRSDPESYKLSIHVLATAPAYRTLQPGQPAWNRTVRYELGALFARQKYFERSADPEALADYARTMLGGIEALADDNGENCHRYLTATSEGPDGHLDAPALLSREQLQDEATAMAAIINSAVSTPLPGRKPEVPWQSLRPIETQIRDEFHTDWTPLWSPWKLQDSKVNYCLMARRFIKLVLNLPEPERTQVLRAWLRPFG